MRKTIRKGCFPELFISLRTSDFSKPSRIPTSPAAVVSEFGHAGRDDIYIR